MELTKRKEKKRKNERKCSPASNKLENQRSGNTESLEGLRSEAVKKKKRRREMKNDWKKNWTIFFANSCWVRFCSTKGQKQNKMEILTNVICFNIRGWRQEERGKRNGQEDIFELHKKKKKKEKERKIRQIRKKRKKRKKENEITMSKNDVAKRKL